MKSENPDLKQRYPKVKFFGCVSIKENVSIGEGTQIGEYVVISNNAKIGRNCHILYHVSICKDAVIGDNVFLGPGVRLLNDKYPPTKKSRPPTIRDNVVIGGGAIILPRVIVFEDAIVGAGSIVTRNVQPREVWAGNPAKFLMTREKFEHLKRTQYI